MLRIFLMACIAVFVVGCSNKEEEREQEQKKVLKQMMNQKYDHRSLEQRVRDSAERKKEKEQQQKQ